MSRCTCCNQVLTRSNGYRTLPDGTKVEETFCSRCRAEVNSCLYESDYDTREYKFEGVIEQQLRYGAVTPAKKVQY